MKVARRAGGGRIGRRLQHTATPTGEHPLSAAHDACCCRRDRAALYRAAYGGGTQCRRRSGRRRSCPFRRYLSWSAAHGMLTTVRPVNLVSQFVAMLFQSGETNRAVLDSVEISGARPFELVLTDARVTSYVVTSGGAVDPIAEFTLEATSVEMVGRASLPGHRNCSGDRLKIRARGQSWNRSSKCSRLAPCRRGAQQCSRDRRLGRLHGRRTVEPYRRTVEPYNRDQIGA
jgi:hypothetical protein